ncbi:MAG TPA: hypothetical protein VED01_09740 [Burkholderiales bacterium]|nr:hypothetical protein [Burkholderiales bacterium]
MSVHPVLAISLVLVALGTCLGVLQACQRRLNLHPEVARKLLHVAMGFAVLTFPFIFDRAWPVAVLAALSIALLLAIRRVRALRGALGGAVHGVSRESWGEICFPLAVCVLFFVTNGDPVRFGVPILMLTLADATAALIGVRYGSVRYATPDGLKSIEGSAAFFAVAFLSTHVPVLLFTDTGRIESLLIGVLMGIVIMLVEAISWRGLDNLFIPLFGYLLLQRYLGQDAVELAQRLAVLIALSFAVLVWRKRTTLDESGLIAAALVGYATWALGGWHWLVAPLTGFFTYTLLWPRTDENTAPFHNAHVVLAVTVPSLVWLAISARYGQTGWVYFSTLAYAVQLALIGSIQTRYAFSRGSSRRHPVYSSAIAWAVMFTPFVLLSAQRDAALVLAAAALPLTALAVSAFLLLKRRLAKSAGGHRWALHAAIGGAATVAAVPAWTALV